MIANISEQVKEVLTEKKRRAGIPDNETHDITAINAMMLQEMAEREMTVLLSLNGKLPGKLGVIRQVEETSFYRVHDVEFWDEAVISLTTSVKATFIPINVSHWRFYNEP